MDPVVGLFVVTRDIYTLTDLNYMLLRRFYRVAWTSVLHVLLVSFYPFILKCCHSFILSSNECWESEYSLWLIAWKRGLLPVTGWRGKCIQMMYGHEGIFLFPCSKSHHFSKKASKFFSYKEIRKMEKKMNSDETTEQCELKNGAK